MGKKVFIFLLILIINLFICSALAYTDTAGHWAENDINILSLNNIISGYEDGTFRPNRNMTRAELVTVINRMLGNTIQNNRYVPDINAKDWYYSEIRKAIESGIIEGDSNGMVNPNELITRQEAVVMLARAFTHLGGEISGRYITDIEDVAPWAKQAINTFIVKGYIKGYNDNTIRPTNKITRAEVVKLIRNIISVYGNYGRFTGMINGNLLVQGKNVILSNLTINGNLIIAEGAQNIEMENIIINGDLILRNEVNIPQQNFTFKGSTYDITPNIEKDTSIYENADYGIKFSVPDGAKVVLISGDRTGIDFKAKNLMTITVNKNDDLYFKPFNQAANVARTKFDIAYEELLEGKIGIYKYMVYGNEVEESYLLYIKRDNIEYAIYFFNIDSINVIDSLINSVQLFGGNLVDMHEIKTYRNPALYLKFNYLDYTTVDDSYNTGIVNEEESFFKMFIQVTNIIDMSDYTIDQLKDILVSLEDTDGTIIDTKVQKVYTYDAIEYTVANDGKLTKSLYIVISNKLYHFIFTGEEDQMNMVGIDIYQDIINSVEF